MMQEKLLKRPPTDAEKKGALRDFAQMVLQLKNNGDLKLFFEHHGESYASGIVMGKTENFGTDGEKVDPLTSLSRNAVRLVDNTNTSILMLI